MAKGLFGKFRQGLSRTSKALGFKGLFKAELDEELFEDLEERMLIADMGPSFVMEQMDLIRDLVDEGKIKTGQEVYEYLKKIMLECLEVKPAEESSKQQSQPAAWVFLGVNGVGKTTSLGKLAHRLRGNGFDLLLAAGDTFRAAASEQLKIWAERTDSQIVYHSAGGSPSAVVFDAVEAAKNRKVDYLLIDTAGRLHNKKHLMEECSKMFRILKEKGGIEPEEVYLVVDATTGQNAVQQAQLFGEIAPITGLILTKLDGSAKGGVGIQLVHRTQIPIAYVGLGEGAEDLEPFDPEAYVDAILGEDLT